MSRKKKISNELLISGMFSNKTTFIFKLHNNVYISHLRERTFEERAAAEQLEGEVEVAVEIVQRLLQLVVLDTVQVTDSKILLLITINIKSNYNITIYSYIIQLEQHCKSTLCLKSISNPSNDQNIKN